MKWHYLFSLFPLFFLGACGGDKPGVVSDPAFCANFYLVNSSNYTLEIEEENWGPQIDTYDSTIAAGARGLIGSTCSIGGYPYPSEYFTAYSVYTSTDGVRDTLYSGIKNEDWRFERPDETGYASRILFLDDSGVIEE